jgi:hypothetical protein
VCTGEDSRDLCFDLSNDLVHSASTGFIFVFFFFLRDVEKSSQTQLKKEETGTVRTHLN